MAEPMRAIKIAPDRSLRLAEVREPTLKPGEVRVGTAVCGICGSDLHMRRSPMIPAGSIMGHELSGRIVELGPEVEGWECGDRVCVFPFTPCERCPQCVAGNEHLCANAASTGIGLGARRGGYAETIAVPQSTLHRLPDELSYEHGALTEPLAVGMHGVAVAEADPAEPVAVIGAGPIGAMTAVSLRVRGHGRLVVIESNPQRRGRIEALGFRAIGLDRVQVEANSALGDTPPVVVFECAGSAAAPQLAVDLVAPDGRIVLLGALEESLSIPQLPLLTKEAQIRASFAYRRREFEEAIELLSAGRVPADELITDVVPLEEAEAMFDELTQPETKQLKVLLRP